MEIRNCSLGQTINWCPKLNQEGEVDLYVKGIFECKNCKPFKVVDDSRETDAYQTKGLKYDPNQKRVIWVDSNGYGSCQGCSLEKSFNPEEILRW